MTEGQDLSTAGPRSGYRGRFAPSPTGPLHAGSLLSAFGSWLLARSAGGEWLVRIEDVDRTREVAGAAAAQLSALEAFGLRPDAPVVYQAQREPIYQQALEKLLDDRVAFECHCSRGQLAAVGGVHRRCVARSNRRDPAIRFRVPDNSAISITDRIRGHVQQYVDREVGDFVLRRSDGCWAYQMAVVVDDAAQGISEVVRGADLIGSTARQILLQRALGLPTPRYAHLPLLLDAAGRKLSKSARAEPLDPSDPIPALRSAWRILGQDVACLLDATDVKTLLERAVSNFEPGRIPVKPGRSEPPATSHKR
ncbi:tRNA glutamyl-Q(34) synthetase GluQRS [Lysobacter sp. A03]|uniref:tRNA glutamyl-Q(34) synthetase GluQRS n=1 Tax=Lysobacter sp. A03 TaxID=1199154 RepID=UPI0005B6EF75|nr:tRNA glutamyl-Q(34) synthetase GluQRS [Lysobacter sp. A03]KIQ96737.1 glutamyl-Q-tRNA synthetase [Lysobacter sp. A03]